MVGKRSNPAVDKAANRGIPVSSLTSRRCGALANPGGSVTWRVWAPRVNELQLVLIDGGRRRHIPMSPADRGFFKHTESNIKEGQAYAFSLDGGPERPDPCSLWQPEGVSGPSAVMLPHLFEWHDKTWRGIQRRDLVFYEVHIGTFTPEGTFDSAISRLKDLVDLGITAIEIMPINEFPGSRNWGYDGVLPYAAHHAYGGPHALHRFVNACHAHGLAVILDVVYNHMGPEGNYLREFGPYFTDRYKTPWGEAVNFDGAGCDAVRDFVLDNVRMWLEEFHCDGLRLDAVHAIFDLGGRHILRAIKEVAEQVAESRGYPAYIIAESDLNDDRLLQDRDRGGHALDSQWSDDFHHAVHAFLTGEKKGYYVDFGQPSQLAKVMEHPFLFAWQFSEFRDRKHGMTTDIHDGDRFVVCIQNHDQVGNRARGERIDALLESPEKRRLAASLLLLSPYLPLLFMGEEYGEENPFPFFCSFTNVELQDAIREGRKREFADFAWHGEVPDACDPATFEMARLNWSWPAGSQRAGLRQLYKDLIAMRQELSALRDLLHRSAWMAPDNDIGPVLVLQRGSGLNVVTVACNLSNEPHDLPPDVPLVGKIRFSSESLKYGGSRSQLDSLTALLPFECVLVDGPVS